MTNAVPCVNSDAGDPHVRFDEGDVAPGKPRCGSSFHRESTNDDASTATGDDNKSAVVQYVVPFTEAVVRYVKGFTTDGRASRSEFWWAVLFSFVFSGGASTILGESVFGWILTITLVILGVCIGWRRMHDVGESGLCSLVPFYNLYLGMKPSVLVENKYGPVPNTNTVHAKKPHKIIITAIFIVSLALFLCCGSEGGGIVDGGGGPVAVSQYTQKQIEDLSSEVASWATKRPEIVRRVEGKHGTVTVKSVQVKHFSIQTVDGGNLVYGDGENISEYKLVLRFWWDGIIHENGHTDIGFVINKAGECVKTWTDDTDALIDLEDPDFWYGVGAALGSML